MKPGLKRKVTRTPSRDQGMKPGLKRRVTRTPSRDQGGEPRYFGMVSTVHEHKYSSPSIFYYIFHIKLHVLKKKIKAISGQIFMKFISKLAEFFEFYWFI